MIECNVRVIWLVGMMGLPLGMAGCGDAGNSAPTAAISGQQQTAASTAAEAPKADSPVEAVASFLEAVRRGDREAARGMLTPLAIQKTEEHNLDFSPPGSETATFQIGDVQDVGQGTAQVASIWTDLDEDGNPRPERITWRVKESDSIWRISGMLAEVGPDRPPIEIDFEQPDELVRRQNSGSVQPEQETALPDRQATRPEDPFQQTAPR